MMKTPLLKKIFFAQTLIAVTLFSSGCLFSRSEVEEAPEKQDSIEGLTLSKLQTRIDQLDAKIAALTDKLDATSPATSKATLAAAATAPGLVKVRDGVHTETLDGPASPSVSASEDPVIQSFAHAMELFKTQKFEGAQKEFKKFVEDHPEHVLAGSAQFYIGETYYHLGQLKPALTEYSKVISSFSTSPRVASAVVKMSEVYKNLGNASDSERAQKLAMDLFRGNPYVEAKFQVASARAVSNTKLETAPIETNHKHGGSHADKESDGE